MQPAMVMELVATKTATAATYRFLKASTSAQSLVCNVRRFTEFSASAFTVAFQVGEIETLRTVIVVHVAVVSSDAGFAVAVVTGLD